MRQELARIEKLGSHAHGHVVLVHPSSRATQHEPRLVDRGPQNSGWQISHPCGGAPTKKTKTEEKDRLESNNVPKCVTGYQYSRNEYNDKFSIKFFHGSGKDEVPTAEVCVAVLRVVRVAEAVSALVKQCLLLARVFQCVVCARDLCISQEDESDPEDDDVDDDADMSEVRAAVLRMARAA